MLALRAVARRMSTVRPRQHRAALGVLPLLLVLAACDLKSGFPQTTFDPVSEFGEILNSTFFNTFWWTMVILVIVIVMIIYVSLRFRERPGTPRPKPIHGHTGLEIAWTIAPAVIVVAISIPTVAAIFDTQRRPPEDALVIEVIGHQWWWEFNYPQYNVRTANMAWLPVGRPVSLKMRSVDVIHSFWIPRIGGKRDVNPLPRRRQGEAPKHDNYLLFTVKEPGHYLGQCAEYCGESHAIMRMTVNAVEPAEFASWVQRMGGSDRGTSPAAANPAAGAAVVNIPEEQRPQPQATLAGVPSPTPAQVQGQLPMRTPPTTPAIGQMPMPTGAGNPYRAPLADTLLVAEGRRIFSGALCVTCHAVAGTNAAGTVGPNLTLFGTRPWIGAGAVENTQENLIRWIKNPKAVKPGTLMPGTRAPGGDFPPTNLTDAEVRAVAAYLSSLK
jgi:cytochrome c oxidase subunit 2